MSDKLRKMYREIHPDLFPPHMEIRFHDDAHDQTLVYEKVDWTVEGARRGLRYGENPDQDAAMYKLVNGGVHLGDIRSVPAQQYLMSDVELIQAGKHPSKINITDVDSALNILRYLHETPCAVVTKHNNPSGVARADSIVDAYTKAYLADRIAAFGGAVALNRPVDKACAEAISSSYVEVVAAPDYEEGAVEILAARKNLRIMRIPGMSELKRFAGARFIEPKALIDGSMILQWSFSPSARSSEDLLSAKSTYKGTTYEVHREPTPAEYEDMIFGWLVEAGVTSNSVIYVKDGVTVGIGTGEQDRVGVAQIARDKAYRKMADRICFRRHGTGLEQLEDAEARTRCVEESNEANGGLKGSVMISDAFFPFADGPQVGIDEGVTAILQPGGSLRDFEPLELCNAHGVAMKFTGQRSFRH